MAVCGPVDDRCIGDGRFVQRSARLPLACQTCRDIASASCTPASRLCAEPARPHHGPPACRRSQAGSCPLPRSVQDHSVAWLEPSSRQESESDKHQDQPLKRAPPHEAQHRECSPEWHYEAFARTEVQPRLCGSSGRAGGPKADLHAGIAHAGRCRVRKSPRGSLLGPSLLRAPLPAATAHRRGLERRPSGQGCPAWSWVD